MDVGHQKQPMMPLEISEFRSKLLSDWIRDYYEWIDLDSLHDAVLNSLAFMGSMTEADEAKVLAQIESLKAIAPEKPAKVVIRLGRGPAHLGVNQEFYATTNDVSELRGRYNEIVREIFKVDILRYPDKLSQAKQFYRAHSKQWNGACVYCLISI